MHAGIDQAYNAERDGFGDSCVHVEQRQAVLEQQGELPRNDGLDVGDRVPAAV
ncbi:hypothetical protein [Amycolatopsis sp. NPDC051071]|uniref:hypothetical protein n=1 Tax=Amycolatopsis sp. NPDC051071 TaxID=3154637 RepID=UPI00341C5574